MIDGMDVLRFCKSIEENARICRSLIEDQDFPDSVAISEYLGQIILFAQTIQVELVGQM